MCFALKKFLERHEAIDSITQKFCTPGHSSIQEVDNLHSHLEKAFKTAEMYSPVSVIRTMNEVRPESMVTVQMKTDMFFDFQAAASKYLFKHVPFSKAKSFFRIKRNQPLDVYYKLSFDADFIQSSIQRTTRHSTNRPIFLQDVKHLVYNGTLSAKKVKDLKSMLKFMPRDEALFMRTICKLWIHRLHGIQSCIMLIHFCFTLTVCNVMCT